MEKANKQYIDVVQGGVGEADFEDSDERIRGRGNELQMLWYLQKDFQKCGKQISHNGRRQLHRNNGWHLKTVL